MSAIAARRRVLFLYNVPDWAIHNVGRDWAGLLEDTHEFSLVRFGAHEDLRAESFDHVVWGYSTLGYSGRTLLASLVANAAGWWRWRGAHGGNLAAVVQDPSELFPEVEEWSRAPAHTAHLRRFARLAVTSNEMQRVVHGLGFEAAKVNTRSLLPLREPGTLGPERLRAFTRAQPYPRKNLPLFHAVRGKVGARLERCEAIVGGRVLQEIEYVRQIDGFNCYVCTSWQEGGPLPLMDAQRRGCVVLTTRVGQTDELVEDGVNGFFCDGEADFVHRLQQLEGDPKLLAEMRHNALLRAAVPEDARVRAQLMAFLP